MSVTISLSDLANLCISHPEPGVVNFLALRSLLLAILRHLGIQDVQTEERPELWTVPEAAARARSLGPYQQLEHRLQELEQQVRELSRLPTGTELLERSKRDSKAVSDMWSLLQLRKSSETNREGVGKVMSLMEEMVLEINSLKNFKNTVEDRITHIGNNLDTVSNHVALVSELLTKAPEQLQRFVTWNILQTTLVESPTDASPDTESSPPSLLPGQPAQPPGVEAQASVATVQAHKVTMPQESERIDQVSRIDPSSLAEDLEPSEKPPDTLTSSALFKTSEDGSQYYPETVSALKRIRHVSDGQPALVHRVSALEKTLSELVSGDRAGKGAESSGDLDGNDMRAQVSHLRDMVKNIDEELKELRKFQPTSSEAGSQTQQQFLDETLYCGPTHGEENRPALDRFIVPSSSLATKYWSRRSTKASQSSPSTNLSKIPTAAMTG
uniref:uncharacterized protein C16orf96 homolog isoform X2 n=1 Tax=Pristiophorus japonicus TaxID=55135 RepID=UPI00398F8175